MSGPSQPKVIGEDWSDERIKSFLALKCYGNTHPDFHQLQEAYQHMIAKDFERFITFFIAAGRDINAINEAGETILDHVSEHARSQDFAGILTQAGALTTPR